MPATQIHSQSRADITRRETWWESSWGGAGGSSESNNKTSATLSFPSIYGNHWIIYKPLPLPLCERLCDRGGISELTTTMLCPVAVSTAAAAVWLLAVLGPGLPAAAEDNSDPGFSLCSHCFYRQTPPQGASAGPLLHPLCHTLPGGRTFATLSKPTCDTAVYYAFHLSHGSTERDGEKGDALVVRAPLSCCLKKHHLFFNDRIRKMVCGIK